MRASGCNTPGTRRTVASARVLPITIRCSLISGWRCNRMRSKNAERVTMKATVLGGAAASLLTISAFAADLGVRPALLQPVIPPFTWTSCYAGVHAGGGWGKKELTDTIGIFNSITSYSSVSDDVSGYMLGGQIGCN